jgi:hypothetical protein
VVDKPLNCQEARGEFTKQLLEVGGYSLEELPSEYGKSPLEGLNTNPEDFGFLIPNDLAGRILGIPLGPVSITKPNLLRRVQWSVGDAIIRLGTWVLELDV